MAASKDPSTAVPPSRFTYCTNTVRHTDEEIDAVSEDGTRLLIPTGVKEALKNGHTLKKWRSCRNNTREWSESTSEDCSCSEASQVVFFTWGQAEFMLSGGRVIVEIITPSGKVLNVYVSCQKKHPELRYTAEFYEDENVPSDRSLATCNACWKAGKRLTEKESPSLVCGKAFTWSLPSCLRPGLHSNVTEVTLKAADMIQPAPLPCGNARALLKEKLARSKRTKRPCSTSKAIAKAARKSRTPSSAVSSPCSPRLLLPKRSASATPLSSKMPLSQRPPSPFAANASAPLPSPPVRTARTHSVQLCDTPLFDLENLPPHPPGSKPASEQAWSDPGVADAGLYPEPLSPRAETETEVMEDNLTPPTGDSALSQNRSPAELLEEDDWYAELSFAELSALFEPSPGPDSPFE